MQFTGVPCVPVDDEPEQEQTCKGHQEPPEAHPVDRLEDFVVIVDEGDVPFRILREGGPVDKGPFPGLPVPEHDHFRIRFLQQPGDFVEALQRGALPSRATDDLAGAGQQESERGGIEQIGIQRVAEPGQVDVQSADRRDFTALVPEGIRVGRQPHDGIGLEKVGVAPDGLPAPEYFPVSGMEGIVVVFAAELFDPDAAAPVLRGIGLEEPSLFRVIVGEEGHAAPYDVPVRLDQPFRHRKQGIGPVEMGLHVSETFLHGRFSRFEGVHDDSRLGGEFDLHPLLEFFLQERARICILHDGDGLQQQGGKDDDAESRFFQFEFHGFRGLMNCRMQSTASSSVSLSMLRTRS